MCKTAQVTQAMIGYFEGDLRRINHLLKVFAYASTIGQLEMLDPPTQRVLELAALTHDIGIKVSERKYGSASGLDQQREGPAEAEMLLHALQVDPDVTQRVCWLIAHHHTYDHITGLDYQILVEADFLVNMDEDGMSEASIRTIGKQIFRTAAGLALLRSLYPFCDEP